MLHDFVCIKFIQFVVRDTSKKRITVVYPRENERNSKFFGSISRQEGADFFQFCTTDRTKCGKSI